MKSLESKSSVLGFAGNFSFRSKHIIFIVYGLLAALFISGLYQKLYKSADNRIKFHAVPVAISTLYQEHKHDYRAWSSTEKPFQAIPGLLEDHFISEQIKVPVDKDQGHYYWAADDRGYADYVIASFWLFGAHMKSLYFFWFAILFLSVTLFIISFGKYTWIMAYLALLMLGIHSAASLLKLQPAAVPIYEPRYLEVLALVPTMHMIFTASFLNNKKIFKNLGPLLGQVAIFVFLYHARSSIGWELLAILLASLTGLLIRKGWTNKCFPLIISIFLLGSCTVLLPCYKNLTYHPAYLSNMGARTFWHNALMGVFIKNIVPNNIPSDLAAAEQVFEYAKKSGCSEQMKQQTAYDFLFTCLNIGDADWLEKTDWVEYEYWAKKLFFSLIKKYKLKAVILYVLYKPWLAIKDTIFPKPVLFAGQPKTQSFKLSVPWSPFHLIHFIPFLLVVLGTGHSLYKNRKQLLMISSLMFFCSMIPPVAFYPDIVTHGGMSVMMVLLLYLGIFIGSPYIYHWLKNYKSKQKMSRIN